jgi:hypothetical protein
MNRKKAPPDIYYVYLYLRPEDDGDGPAGTPYYAGKGKDLRAFGKNHSCDVPQGKENIVFVATGLSESDAFQRERDQIRLYGRIGVEEGGCLLNRSSGGNGASGRIMPEEERLCRIAQIGAREAKLTPEQRLARTEATRKRKREYLARLIQPTSKTSPRNRGSSTPKGRGSTGRASQRSRNSPCTKVKECGGGASPRRISRSDF